jgi:superfamily I DNA/RNA helicase
MERTSHRNVDPSLNGAAFLCRSNRGVLELSLHLANLGYKIKVNDATMRDIDVVSHMVIHVKDLQEGSSRFVGEIPKYASDIKTYAEYATIVRSDASKKKLESVRMREAFGYGSKPEVTKTINAWVDALTPPSFSDICVEITTAHAAKGRQWSQVLIASDFMQVEYKGRLNEYLTVTEVNVLYTAVTRAQEKLYLPQYLYSVYQNSPFMRPPRKTTSVKSLPDADANIICID